MLAPTFLRNSGIIRFNGTPFFTGDGSTSSATLLDRHGNAISSGKLKNVSAIHRTDWRGRVLLTSSARKNYAWATEAMAAAPYSFNLGGSGSVTPTANYALGADGVSFTATRLVFDIGTGSGGAGDLAQISQQGHALTVGASMDTSVYLRTNSGSNANMMLVGVGTTPIQITVTSSWQRFDFPQAVVGGSFVFRLRLRGNESTALHADILAWGLQVNDGALPKPYVKNTSSSSDLTITDYTLTGPSVSFGEAPVTGAVCDWDGKAKR